MKSQLFGSPEDFGIEAGLEHDGHISHSLWGHMKVWCRGHSFGSYEQQYCGLGRAYHEFRDLAARLETLWAPQFEGLDHVGILRLFEGLLGGVHDWEAEDRYATPRSVAAAPWRRFVFLTNWCESFYDCEAYILCPPGGDILVLSRDLPDETGGRASVTRRNFLSATEGFSRWFEEESRRLGIPC